MSIDPTEDPRSAAIERLEQFGLSAYAARTFVALVEIGSGTAKDVSQESDVPRTRVYDAVDELRRWNLVDVQQSSPKQFWVVSTETARQKLERTMQRRATDLTTALSELEPAARREEQRGVWTVDGREAVTDRVLEFFASADHEIVYMSVEDLLTDDVVDGLRDAADRGVSIKLAGISPDVQKQIRDVVPDAELFDSLWLWSDTPAGRVMMVDRTQTLASVLVNGGDGAPDDPWSETAIWGAGETNGLVVVLKGIFTWRLEPADHD